MTPQTIELGLRYKISVQTRSRSVGNCAMQPAFSTYISLPGNGRYRLLLSRISPNAGRVRQHDALHRTTRSKLDASAQSAILPSTTATNFPPCVPEIAENIEDEAARAMLRRIQYTSVKTNLPQPDILTSHCASKGSDDTATPFMFLHGFDSSMLEYRYMLPLLDDMPDVDAHFVDILGWGLTEKPKSKEFSYAPTAKREHLRACHQQIMQSKPMVLVGASIGGAVALDFALEYPDKVKRLVLIDSQAFTDKQESALMQRLPILASWGADVLRSHWLRKVAVQMSYENEKFKCEDTIRITSLHCYSDGWKEAAMDFIIGEGYCISARVKDIACPTLVLWGDDDRVLPKGHPEKFLQTISMCELKVFDNCGHSPHIEHPNLVAKRITEFTTDLAPKSSS